MAVSDAVLVIVGVSDGVNVGDGVYVLVAVGDGVNVGVLVLVGLAVMDGVKDAVGLGINKGGATLMALLARNCSMIPRRTVVR